MTTRVGAPWMPSAEKRQRDEHGIEWSWNWQYGRTARILRGLPKDQVAQLLEETSPPDVLKAPPNSDEGWEVNVDCNHTQRGYLVMVPVWCNDGTAISQTLYWRRRVPGMTPHHKRYQVADIRDERR